VAARGLCLRITMTMVTESVCNSPSAPFTKSSPNRCWSLRIGAITAFGTAPCTLPCFDVWPDALQRRPRRSQLTGMAPWSPTLAPTRRQQIELLTVDGERDRLRRALARARDQVLVGPTSLQARSPR
jgi:hypothetical protein